MDKAPQPPPLPDAPRPHRTRALRPARRPGRIFGLVFVLLVCLVGAGLVAQGIRTPSPAPAKANTEEGSSARLYTLPFIRPDVVREGASVYWTDGEQRRYRLVDHLGEHGVRIRTGFGDLDVDAATFDGNTGGPPAGLPRLVAAAHDASLAIAGMRVETDTLTGLRLASDEAIVADEVVLRREDGTGRDAAQEHGRRRRALAEEVSRFLAALDAGPMDESVKQATREILNGLAERDGRSYWGSLQPHVTRRLVRHGWLNLFDVPEDRVRALEAAVEAACRPVPVRRFAAAGHALTFGESSFGRSIAIYESPTTTRYTCPQPEPQWLSQVPPLTAIVDLPAGSDPFSPDVEPTAAAVYSGSVRLADWRKGAELEPVKAGFTEPDPWADHVQARLRADDSAVRNLFPPHVVVANALGDVYALVTPHGVLRPAKDGSKTETQRFLDEAAAALPGAAYLDLIGEVLYDYAWDTTAYDRPLLVGTQTDNGDIHQTLAQTLATCAGGCYRGDCDDMACFYHTLARHQGHNAHVMKQPWHLACAWADQLEDGTWTSYVLHTGPPLQFFGRDLDAVLRATYAHFQSQETIDLQALPFALRFGDDAVRETYYLPGEIFADRVYALALIAVQGAYRDHTYLTGVETMRAVMMLRKDPTCADYSEIANLLTWAGRHAEATSAFEAMLARSPDTEPRVDAALALLVNLVRRSETQRAASLATDLSLRWIPQLERARKRKVVGPWMRAAAALVGSSDATLRLRGLQLIAYQALERAAPSLQRIGMLAARDDFNPQWLHYQGLPMHETNVTSIVQGAIGALAATRSDTSVAAQNVRKVLDELVQKWFQRIAFRTIHTHESRLARHGLLAAWYATRVDPEKLAAAIEHAGSATAEDIKHLVPESLDAGLPDARTLRLLRITPGVHRAAWWSQMASAPEAYDAAAARRALEAERDAYDELRALGLEHWTHPPGRLLVRVAQTLVDEDETAFREVIGHVAALRNHDLRKQVARVMQLAALRLDVPVFERWLRIWADAMDDDGRDGFELAWSAMLSERPQHALAAARLTAQHHPDHAAFATELAHMEKLVR